MHPDAEDRPVEEYELPCAEALLAGTLALMTSHAEGCCEQHRRLMTARIVSHLTQLSGHAILSAEFRSALWSLRSHWQALLDRQPAASADPRLWHPAASAVQ